jgi:hypothetical protein
VNEWEGLKDAVNVAELLNESDCIAVEDSFDAAVSEAEVDSAADIDMVPVVVADSVTVFVVDAVAVGGALIVADCVLEGDVEPAAEAVTVTLSVPLVVADCNTPCDGEFDGVADNNTDAVTVVVTLVDGINDVDSVAVAVTDSLKDMDSLLLSVLEPNVLGDGEALTVLVDDRDAVALTDRVVELDFVDVIDDDGAALLVNVDVADLELLTDFEPERLLVSVIESLAVAFSVADALFKAETVRETVVDCDVLTVDDGALMVSVSWIQCVSLSC